MRPAGPLKAAEKRDTLELASRLRQHITGIMREAVEAGHIDSNPANDLQGATATGKVQHRPALPLERLPELPGRIEADGGRSLTHLAIQLIRPVAIADLRRSVAACCASRVPASTS
ncbi:phage integrase central domain-containing protein [Azotobacter vinelandii]|uniref:phage integrase central domain-containing protein n=1 Tax=Azotobacter vinelandii TaxID=354 RepID=UPI0035A2358F